jgi:hypothetical protein
MSNYVPWQRFEEILVNSTSAQTNTAKKYPNEMVRWSILRRRNGRFCPMARGILKLIVYNERENTDFIEVLDSRKWKDVF